MVTQTMNINNILNCLQLFPRVVLLNIYHNLDIKSLYNCSLVNKHFNKLFNNDILWDKLICDHYGIECVNRIKLDYNIGKSLTVYKNVGDLLYINKRFHLNETFEELLDYEELSLFNYGMVSLPKEIRSLVNLTYLDLDNNKLISLPKEIGSLVNLKELFISNNKLTKLPKEIGSLVNLQDLAAFSNELTELPTEIGSLVNLLYVNLNYNKLTKLPEEIGQLVNLQYIDIRNNPMTELPKGLRKIDNLQLVY